MAIWTNGTDFVLATGWGIARSGARAQSVLCFSLSGLRRDEDPPEVVSLVVLDDEGTRALVQRRGEPPSIWTHGPDGGRLEPCDAPEVAMVAAAPGGPMVALSADRTGGGVARRVLRRARLDGARLVLGDVLAIPEAPRLQWSDGIMKDGEGWPEQPLRDDEDDDDDEPEDPPFDPRVLSCELTGALRGHWRGTVRLSANRFGVGVSSTYSGLVAVLEPQTLAFRLVARVPALREQFDLYTLPMAAGMLVTLVANYRHTEYVHVDEAAAVRGKRHLFGKELAWGASSPGVAWDEATALVNHVHGDDQIQSLAMPALAAKRFTEDPGIVVDAGSSPDGSVHLLAVTQSGYLRPKNWQLARWTKKAKRWRAAEVEVPDFRPVEPPPVPVGPEHARGTPTLGVIADPAIPWRARAGAELVLRLRVENRGGPAPGLTVEVTGAALGEGLVQPLSISVEGRGAPAAFTPTTTTTKGASAPAELPDAAIEAAFAVAQGRGRSDGPPPPPPAVVLALRLSAVRAGQALLSVRVGPRGGAGTAGSAMMGRSFVVEAGE